MNQFKKLLSIAVLSLGIINIQGKEQNFLHFLETEEIHPEFENALAFLHQESSKGLDQLLKQTKMIQQERECIENIHDLLQKIKSNDSDAMKIFAQRYEQCKYLFEINRNIKKLESQSHTDQEVKPKETKVYKNLGDYLRSVILAGDPRRR